jgi:hypothetical protein
MATSYWIAHPTEKGFISALSPEGVGQLLILAEGWPAGLYIILQHWHTTSPMGQDLRWGHVVKDGNGVVRIMPLDEPQETR